MTRVKPPGAHARQRMMERGISSAEVDEVLASPQTSYPSAGHGDRTVVLGQTASGRRLKVVVLSNDMECVVTVADRDEEA